MSGTIDNKNWYETNVPPHPVEILLAAEAEEDPDEDIDDDDDGHLNNFQISSANMPTTTTPQWARDIQQRLDIAVPADMHFMRGGYASDDEGDGVESDDEAVEGMDGDVDFDDDVDVDERTGVLDENGAVPQLPEIHPHRFRLHGLAISPGGGATAVVASSHSTQYPERGGWHTVRSTVYFDSKPRFGFYPIFGGGGGRRGRLRRKRQRQRLRKLKALTAPQNKTGGSGAAGSAGAADMMIIDPSLSDPPPCKTQALTTEAKLFEWLYGSYGGVDESDDDDDDPQTTAAPNFGEEDEISGVTTPTTYNVGDEASRQKERLRELFRPALERQKCDLCGTKMAVIVKRGNNDGGENSNSRVVGNGGGGNGTATFSVCEKGHVCETCTTSGLAVQKPGISRNCGACGARTMRADKLAEKVLAIMGLDEKDGDSDGLEKKQKREEILKVVRDAVCGGCGGKFLN